MYNILNINTNKIEDQKPGTSGLRKKTKIFSSPHYLQNYIQSVFNAIEIQNKIILIGGDGRFFNKEAIQIIISQAIANKVGKIYIAKDGILSTPAASNIIRKYGIDYGIILSASHNPAGIDGDFGIKINCKNGAPAPSILGDLIYEHTKNITFYNILENFNFDISQIQDTKILTTQIEVIDGIVDYVLMLKSIFDFPKISQYLQNNNKILFNSFCGITGPYAKSIFVDELNVSQDWLLNNDVKEDFGNLIPDPNPHSAKDFMQILYDDKNAKYGFACDADGDRNFIFSKNFILEPSDALPIILEHIDFVKFYYNIRGVARSKPTSAALDDVAREKNLNLYITPVGWKFFGNLLDNDLITFCCEESFGLGSNHIREKDGLWAIMFYLHIMAHTNKSLDDLIVDLWKKYGRYYFCRHDYENLDTPLANKILNNIIKNGSNQIGNTVNNLQLQKIENFEYEDIDGTIIQNQGIILSFNKAVVVIRISGTGTSGSTIRVYYSQYEGHNILEEKHNFLLNLTTFVKNLMDMDINISARV